MDFRVQLSFSLLTLFGCLLEHTFGRESSWSMTFKQDDNITYRVQPNYMYKDSFVTVSVLCSGDQSPVEISWILQRVDCMTEFYMAKTNSTARLLGSLAWISLETVQNSSSIWEQRENESDVGTTYFQWHLQHDTCVKKNMLDLKDESSSPYFEARFYDSEPTAEFRKVPRRPMDNGSQIPVHRVASVWEDGMYHFLFRIRATSQKAFDANVIIQMRGSYGLLSAIEWPLLPVTGVMSLLYLSAGTLWLFLWAKSQEHTQKIHLVVGAIAVAGALGNTLSFSDMSVRNTDGIGIYGVYWVGVFVSTCQISLTLLLLMIVSTGYGINRPTLSQTHLQLMVLFTAFSFMSKMVLLVVSNETLRIKYNHPYIFTLSSIIYLVTMLLVTGWTMVFSINTFIYLFQRRHSSESKLKVFCLFMACCISVFISHFVMGIVLLSDGGWFRDCRQNWKQEWIASSFNQLLVFFLLSVLMWLWRPMDELMSYGFEPLSTVEPTAEESPDEKEKIMLEEF